MTVYSAIEYDEFITLYTGAALVVGRRYNILLYGKVQYANAELLEIYNDGLKWLTSAPRMVMVMFYDYILNTDTTIMAA
jgi:hypothetical protein